MFSIVGKLFLAKQYLATNRLDVLKILFKKFVSYKTFRF